MAKTNISFNNKNYSIDDTSLSSAADALKSHLSTTMNGTGAVINLGGTAYNVDFAKLTAITNAFVQHLGTIAGDGCKVVVGGVEYGVDAAKMTGAISEIEAVLNGLQSGKVYTFNGDTSGKTVIGNLVKISEDAPDLKKTTKIACTLDDGTVQEVLPNAFDFNDETYMQGFTDKNIPERIFVASVHVGDDETPVGLYVINEPSLYVSRIELA